MQLSQPESVKKATNINAIKENNLLFIFISVLNFIQDILAQKNIFVKLYANFFKKVENILKIVILVCYNGSMVKVILTNSYFNIYSLLIEQLKKEGCFSQSNLIFCEEKSTLMVERNIANKFGGSFFTRVFSFGDYMRAFNKDKTILSPEGSAMVIKKLLNEANLSILNKGKNIATAIYTQIAQLKSAKVSPLDLEQVSLSTKGLLKEKIVDLAKIYSLYEDYLIENNIDDQSTVLNGFSSVVESQEELLNTNIFVVGFSRLTKQNLEGISSLIKKGKSFTAILPFGDNKFAFVNETAKKIKDLAVSMGEEYIEERVSSPFLDEAKFITDNLFCPKISATKKETDKIHLYIARDQMEEAEKVASVIASEVRLGKRYKDFTVILPSSADKNIVKKAFSLLGVPAYFDTEYQAENHPLISLIFSYLNVFIKNFEREALLSLVKNPLFCEDKGVVDSFINYVYKFNVNYSLFKKPFKFSSSTDDKLEEAEKIREKLISNFNKFDVLEFLENNNVKEKLDSYAVKLKDLSCSEEGAVTEQIYSKVVEILKEIQFILKDQVTYIEYKNIFASGVASLKLSIIPQYNDAVFVGDFKECAYAVADNLFVMGLTSSVPDVKEESTLLTDKEMDALASLKLLIEPKVKIVNHRRREEIALGLGSFFNKLYLSMPANKFGKEKNQPSQILTFIQNNFTLLPFPITSKYISFNQGVKNFSISLSNYCLKESVDIEDALSFYGATDKQKTNAIIEGANAEVKTHLKDKSIKQDGVVSPTTLENFYECPYKSFITHALGVKEREIGEVSGIAVGNIMHDIFYLYLSKINSVSDQESSNKLFSECAEEVLKDERYAKFIAGSDTLTQINLALKECKKHCFNTYNFINKSTLKPSKDNLERSFYYQIDDKTTLYGKVDRIDENDEYFRVIDYKTGKVDDTDAGLYYGIKLQLYLYSLAVKDKVLAGLYYFDVQDEYDKKGEAKKPYLKGKTLNEMEAVVSQDSSIKDEGKSTFLPITIEEDEIKGASDKETILALVDYAKKMCKNAVDHMNDGVIIPSPIESACKYCKFKSMCNVFDEDKRKIIKISENEIADIILKEEEYGAN